MDRLSPAKNGGERVVGGAGDVVERLLGGQGDPRRLNMEAEHEGPRVLRLETILHDVVVDPPGGPVLCDLLEKIIVGRQEEAEPAGKAFDRQAPPQHFLGAGDGVGDDEGDLLRGRAAGLTVVVSGEADGIPSGGMPGAEFDGIATDLERGPGRQNARGNGDGRLQQKIVLTRPGQICERDAAVPGIREIHRLDGDVADGLACHQGDADLVDRNAVKEDPHILDGVYRHPAPSHVCINVFVVAVVTAQSGVIENPVDPRGALLQQKFVSLVRLLRGTETGQLPMSPGPSPVHSGMNAAGIGALSRITQVLQIIEVCHVARCVQGLDVEPGKC